MFKAFKLAAPLAVLAMGSSAAFADSANHAISIVAHVPSSTFYVKPVDEALTQTDQTMDFNPATGTLQDVTGYFDVLHTAGSVHASLGSDAKLYNGDGTKSIDLTVRFNNKVLTTTAQEVVTKSAAATNSRSPLRISAPSTAVIPGDYTGSVAMVFDAVVAP